MYRYDFQVVSEALRLPTLKELVGYTPTQTESIAEFSSTIAQSSTTFVDRTIDGNALQDGFVDRAQSGEEPEILIKDIANGDESMSNDGDARESEDGRDKEIFDNDILGSEEIQRRSSTSSFVEGTPYPTSATDREEIDPEKSIKRVEVPVRILDDANGEEIAELVILRLPESKLNSAILKPVFRVKVLEQDEKSRDDIARDGIESVSGSNEISSENELPDDRLASPRRRRVRVNSSSATLGDTGKPSEDRAEPVSRPRNRQRIVKARRRTRVQEVASSDPGEGASIPRENGQVPDGEENSRRREGSDAESSSESDGTTVQSTESSTAVRATTLRRNVTAPSKAPSVIRGFYVTKSSVEASSPDVTTTDISTDSTRYPSVTTGDYGIDETTEKTDLPTLSDETVPPFVEGGSYISDESSTYESIGSTVLESEGETRISNDSLENVAPTVGEKLETSTTDLISTSVDRFTETGPSAATMTEDETSERPEVTTFRPWTSGELQTTHPITSAEATTTEYFTESSSEAIEEESDPTTDHPSESLKTSENSRYGDSSNVVVKSTTVSTTVESDDNDGGTASELQTERSARRTTTPSGKTTTHKEPLKRGRVRFTGASKPDTSKLSSPEHPRVSTKTSRVESDEESRTSTETYGKTAEQAAAQTTGSPHASSLRSRDYRRRTTTLLSIDDSTTTSPHEKDNLSVSSSEADDPPVKYSSRTSSGETTGSSSASRSFSRIKDHSLGTTKPFETDTSAVVATSTEAYDETGQYTTEARKAGTSFVEATGSAQLTSRSDDARKTTETLEDPDDIAIDSTTGRDSTTSSIETGEDTVGYASTTPETDYLSTNFVGTTGSILHGRTLPEETGAVATTTESYDKITETSEPANTVYIADDREEEVRTESTLSVGTTSNSAETTRPWSYLQRSRVAGGASAGNAESIDVPNDVTLNVKTDTFPPTTEVYPTTDRTESSTPAVIEDSGTKVDDAYGVSTEPGERATETTTSPETETTLRSFSAITPDRTTHEKSEGTTTTIPSRTKIDNTVESTAEESSSRYRGVADERSTTESSVEKKVYSTVDSTRNTIAPVTEHRETKRVRGRVRFTNFAAHPDETGRNRRPVKQVVVRRRPVTESNNRRRIVDESSERSAENETPKDSRHPNGQSAEETKNSVELHERFDEKENSAHPNVRLVGEKNRSTSLNDRSTERKKDKKDSARVNDRSAEEKKYSSRANDRSAEKKYSSRVKDRLAGRKNSADPNDRSAEEKKYSSRVNDRSAQKKNSADSNDRSAEKKKSADPNDRSAEKKNSADPNDRSAEKKKSADPNDRSAEKKNSADPNDRSAEEKTYPSRVNGRLADDKRNRTKPTRRRVIVYRGRPRPEIVTSTTTMQSLRASSDELPEDGGRKRRRMWRKRVVLKRERTEEADDQSIAETVDFRRAMIDASLADFRGLGSSIEDPELASSAEQADEDNGGEANPYKSSGGFLRRPGSLVRGQGNNRSKTKTPGNSDSIILPVGQPSVFSKIQPIVAAQEIKTDDQSGRAQELAVTLADPPVVSSATTGRLSFRTTNAPRKISTTIAPRTEAPATSRTTPLVRRRQRPRGSSSNERIVENVTTRPRRPAIIDYDYYVDDDDVRLVVKPELKDKLFVTRKGGIRCLDQGNFAHPTSCKKFITCARMVNGQVIGTEYTCPDKLSFDPVGGICNWSAGLGCEDNKKP